MYCICVQFTLKNINIHSVVICVNIDKIIKITKEKEKDSLNIFAVQTIIIFFILVTWMRNTNNSNCGKAIHFGVQSINCD